MNFKKYDSSLICGILIYFYVNIVFIFKYNPSSISGFWLSLIYVSIVCGIIVLMKRFLDFPKTANILYFAGCAGILVANIVLLYFIDYQSVNVDRASGLHNWNDYLRQGIHPYLSLTHMGHHLSVFPVWAVLHFPFYCLGDVGYSQVFFLVLLFILLLLYFKPGNLLYISLMAMSPAFWYHCAMRSDLLSNLFIALIFIILLLRHRSYLQKHKLIVAFITGLLICTRIFVVVPLAMFFFRY
ncbi:MAG: hypothetical protein LBC19_06850, partial [Tannerella sp.]|nr:hypothetical protein [Tannerella sp.]